MGAVATAASQLELLRGELVAVVRAEIAAAVLAPPAAAAAATTAGADRPQDPVQMPVSSMIVALLDCKNFVCEGLRESKWVDGWFCG